MKNEKAFQIATVKASRSVDPTARRQNEAAAFDTATSAPPPYELKEVFAPAKLIAVNGKMQDKQGQHRRVFTNTGVTTTTGGKRNDESPLLDESRFASTANAGSKKQDK